MALCFIRATIPTDQQHTEIIKMNLLYAINKNNKADKKTLLNKNKKGSQNVKTITNEK